MNGSWKRRISLLALAILPQLLSLAGLAGLFWAVKLKEVFITDASFRTEPQRLVMKFAVSNADRIKVAQGTIVHFSQVISERPQPEIEARVTAITRDNANPTFPWQVTAEVHRESNPTLSDRLGQLSQPIAVKAWTRTRRALSVIKSNVITGLHGKGSADVTNVGGAK